MAKSKQTSRRNADLLWLAITLACLVFVNIIANGFFFHIDLTEDKRFSIHPATRQTLENLDDVVFIEVFLDGADGDLPAGFQRLQRSIRETLDEFKVYAGVNLQYRFTNPGENANPKDRNDIYLQLTKRGLTPTNLRANEKGANVEKIIFPGAIITYAGKESPVMLLKGNQAAPAEVRLNQSVEGLEYELISAIRKVTVAKRPRVAVISGHGELDGYGFNELGLALKERYDLDKVDLPHKLSLKDYDAIVVAQPDSAFSEPDKFKIDQFIIGGGKALFFLDKFKIQIDSVKSDGTLELPLELNLDDLLYRYGARLNNNLVLDINSAAIPLVVGYVGDKPETKLVPWRYYPIVNTFGSHPLVKNMDALYFRFASSIDTVTAKGIKKTPLLFTSRYTREVSSPVRMSFNEARIEPKPEQYKKSNLTVGLLLEGTFHSLYANRLAPETVETFGFKERDKPSKVIIVSDGDFVRNDFSLRRQNTYPLGYDRFAGVQFANMDFALNAMAYLLDDQGFVQAKGKSIKLRPLDRPRIEKEKRRWQMVNIGLPLALLLVFGIVQAALRRRSYTKFKTA